jgi:mannose-6-phosphate isomerase-like protein (cupin superfamily)
MPVIAAPAGHTHELPGTRFTSLVTPSRGSADLCVWQVEVAPGTSSPAHELTREEVFVVLAGRAAVRLGEERLEAGVGDAIVVPPNTLFALANAADEPFRAVVCLPAGGQARIADGEPFTPPWAE